jgi:hypothetical protein
LIEIGHVASAMQLVADERMKLNEQVDGFSKLLVTNNKNTGEVI